MPPEDSSPSGDPRELARKLAEQAKARALAQQLVEKAKAASAAPAAPAPAPKKSLADRAKRPISAKEAMQKAIEDEKRAAAEAAAKKALARAEAEREKAARASRAAEEATAKAKQEAEAQLAAEQARIKEAAAKLDAAKPPAAPTRLQDPAVVLANRLPGVTVRMAKPVANRDVFHALWTAHRARAVAESNLQLIVSADVLLDAARRVPEGALCSARIDYNGAQYAAWVDTASGSVLGTAAPADVFLAGL